MKIPELEQSETVPYVLDLRVRFDAIDGPERLYGGALEVYDLFEADAYLWELAAWRMMREANRGVGHMCWRDAIAIERRELAFYALACDVSPERLAKIKEYPCLAHVARVYGAFLPEGVGPSKLAWEAQEEQIAADVVHGEQITPAMAKGRVRRHYAAKKAGIVTPLLPMEATNAGLFD